MKLLLINPNTTLSMTEAIAAGARAVAYPSTEIQAVQPTFGPMSIEGHYDEAFAAAGQACTAPVLGIAEAAPLGWATTA